jgi:two-component system cell cycle response regulator
MRLGEEFRYVVIFTDISTIQALTTTDQLTGIANRMHFSMVFEHELNVLHREKEPLGVIFFDIDHFKQVNDRYGHLVGDSILRHVAALVKKQIRKSDFVARWGGEEFVILLPRTHLTKTRQVAEMLRQTIEKENFGSVETISCSFGVAALEENESAEALLKRVDRLLYQAKEAGRNCVVA